LAKRDGVLWTAIYKRRNRTTLQGLDPIVGNGLGDEREIQVLSNSRILTWVFVRETG